MSTNVLVVGPGGREDSMGWKLTQSPRLGKLYIAPGNGGTSRIGERVPISHLDFEGLADFAAQHVDLTIVGPDDSLAGGIVDLFQARGLRIFGPTKEAAKIEWSKTRGKIVSESMGSPTAPWRNFSDYDEALAFVRKHNGHMVIKADGPALGKGVYPCRTIKQAEAALKAIMVDKKYGDAGDLVVVEDFLDGPELTAHSVTDGRWVKKFPYSRDYKSVRDGGRGANTGGMGAAVPITVDKETSVDIDNVTGKAVIYLDYKQTPFVGCLYPGFKLTKKGPSVLEYNARPGDPECQVYMRLLETDLLDVVEACVNGMLSRINLSWRPGCVVCVALTSKGYPGKYKTGFPIEGINEAEQVPGVVVFYSGVEYSSTGLVTDGGRVLYVTAVGDTYEQARARAYEGISCISFSGMHYRRDIAAELVTTV